MSDQYLQARARRAERDLIHAAFGESSGIVNHGSLSTVTVKRRRSELGGTFNLILESSPTSAKYPPTPGKSVEELPSPVHSVCLAAKDALMHLQMRREEIIQAFDTPNIPMIALAGFNEEVIRECSGALIQEIHIVSTKDLDLPATTLNAVGRACGPFPSTIFMPSGATLRPPIYDSAGKLTTFESIVPSVAEPRPRHFTGREPMVLSSSWANYDGVPMDNPGTPRNDRGHSQGQGSSNQAGQSQSNAPGRDNEHSQHDETVEDKGNGRDDNSPNASSASATNGGRPGAPSSDGLMAPEESPDPNGRSKTGSVCKIEFDSLALIHCTPSQSTPKSTPFQELHLAGEFNFQFTPGQSLDVDFTELKCQANVSDKSTLRYTQNLLRVQLDGGDDRWKVKKIHPKTTPAFDGLVKYTKTEKNVLQQIWNLALEINPFSSGANLRGHVAKEIQKANEVVLNTSRIIQKDIRGNLYWHFLVDDKYVREEGLDLSVNGNFPSANLHFRHDRVLSNLPPPNAEVEIVSLWSLIQKKGPNLSLTHDAAGPLPPTYSNLYQMIRLDLFPTGNDGSFFETTMVDVGRSCNSRRVDSRSTIEGSSAVVLQDNVELGKALGRSFADCR